MTERSPWWAPHVHADRRPFLLARNRIQAAFRNFFLVNDFIEVDPPALQVSPGNETHLHAFDTRWLTPDGLAVPMYLQTSPEFSCKKLLTAGERRIACFAHAFRNRERSALHVPEFTILEWYRTREPYEKLIGDCTCLLRLAAEVIHKSPWEYKGIRADPHADPECITVAEAFRRYAGVDLLASEDAQALAKAAETIDVRTAPDDTWSDIFSRILSERVEPRLGAGRPVFLTEYPISEAALARPKNSDHRLAERFELYVCGVELANAFGELADPAEQRRRFAAQMDAKAAIYDERYPIDEDFLAALAHMPEASGAALGFDRLVMLATGAERVEQVMWAPFSPPENR